MLNLISELNEEDLAGLDSDDYTASTDSNLSSCCESAGTVGVETSSVWFPLYLSFYFPGNHIC